ncbi:MAG: UDP-N-acetylglucosamine 2-epimerase (non-hydrolyzing), partial [Acidimicrobiia bacterium]
MTNTYGFAPKSIAVVLGTRPEIIKLAHIIRLLDDAALVIHTGQHYDPKLSGSFFPEMGLSEPDVFLGVGGLTRGAQIGIAVRKLDEILGEHSPQAVIVQGDTNSVLAGAVAANAREVAVCHIEAGLRSFDRAMPEEHNRVVTDHLADLCCAPTFVNVTNLANEGIDGERVVQTGNTIVEAVLELLAGVDEQQSMAEAHGVEPGGFVLSTFHRPENVDDPSNFRMILEQLAALELPVVLPLHPRSVKRAEEYGLGDLLARIRVVEPIGYREFLGLEAAAALIVSDSGGVQEEASIVKTPLVVVRNSTERPEVIGTFATRVPPGPGILEAAQEMLARDLTPYETPYGDGTASQKS